MAMYRITRRLDCFAPTGQYAWLSLPRSQCLGVFERKELSGDRKRIAVLDDCVTCRLLNGFWYNWSIHGTVVYDPRAMFVASGRPLLTELMACRRFLCTVHARESTCIITACVVSLQTLLLLKTRTLRLNENLWQVQRNVIACTADVISARLHLLSVGL